MVCDMTSVERLSVRLTPDTMAVLQELVDSGEFRSISDAVARAIESFISSRFDDDEVRDIVRRQGSADAVPLDDLVMDGSTSLEDAVRDAVRDMVRSRIGSEDADG